MRYKLPILLLFCLFACSPTPETKLTKSDITFICPSGWKITAEENIDTSGYYLSCEKDGLNSSGLLSISWVNDSIALSEMLKIYEDELKNNIVYKNSNLKFSNETIGNFNSYSAKTSRYAVSLLGVKHEGVIYCFYGNNKTISILKQEAIEDRSKNKDGFEEIENSFSSK